LTEGKFSFLIIHAIQNCSEGNNEILNILKQKTEDPALKRVVLNIMRNKTKTFDYTREVIQRLHAEAMAEIAKFEPANPLLNKILSKLMV
jgi:geranylgeranyl diphosphate synthase type 3